MKFKKKVVFLPAYDRRHADPKKNYGIHGVTMRFYLIGEKGVVQFVLYTNWQLPHVEAEFDNDDTMCAFQHSHLKPMPVDLGYHSPVPMYEGQSKMDTCEFFEGGCYYDGSSLAADDYYDILRKKGSKGLWKAMKTYYFQRFGNAWVSVSYILHYHDLHFVD